ncbi:hypothetical protein BQ8482_330077 [Mesorhizobium delmotii]|uniref:Uncharacterized protein n=1 Tax=Mesorhizobium delmotii TaxID=1631247 RepID=A0A2P9APF2_9HYPH|nr:hypothetical protein BQ8482_330077 [Mesorhizobium delmotii]
MTVLSQRARRATSASALLPLKLLCQAQELKKREEKWLSFSLVRCLLSLALCTWLAQSYGAGG